MSISMIWAMDKNRTIGRDHALPWKLPRDMAFFKEQTLHKTVLMGRKTWESFACKSLPQRKNIVLTHKPDYNAVGADVIHSLEEGLELAEGKQLMIIGGAEIYKLFWPYADELIVTHIDETFKGDTVFPNLDWSSWKAVKDIPGITDEKNIYRYRFVFYKKQDC